MPDAANRRDRRTAPQDRAQRVLSHRLAQGGICGPVDMIRRPALEALVCLRLPGFRI